MESPDPGPEEALTKEEIQQQEEEDKPAVQNACTFTVGRAGAVTNVNDSHQANGAQAQGSAQAQTVERQPV